MLVREHLMRGAADMALVPQHLRVLRNVMPVVRRRLCGVRECRKCLALHASFGCVELGAIPRYERVFFDRNRICDI